MQVKKQIAILLSFFLLVSNLGLAFNVHYCDDEIASITLNTASNSQEIEKECCGEVEIDSKCCKNKIIKSQDKLDQIIVNTISFDTNFVLVDQQTISCNGTLIDSYKKSDIVSYYCNANGPPLYQLYSQYIFYA
jgi:hypothetical protein